MGEVQHILSAAEYTPQNMGPIFARATELRELDANPRGRRELATKFIGSRAANLFYQESTRTRKSFELAEVALGLSYSTTANAPAFSSVSKGETLEHTIAVLSEYRPDFIVLRHDKKRGAERAANVSSVPIINAGDGGGEHPTQAFLDAYTLLEQLGRLDELNLTFIGDLRFGRTIRSLVYVMTNVKGNHFNFISDPSLRLSDDIRMHLEQSEGISFEEHTDPEVIWDILPRSDNAYVTRTQTNQGAAEAPNENPYRITAEMADRLPEHGIITHPMPVFRSRSRPLATEIAPEVDHHPKARYVRQAGNGLYIRMALIEAILEDRPILAEAA